MKKSIIILLGTVLAVTMILSAAYAWRSVRTGQKNFERAWSAYLFERTDKATEYFSKAADAFGLALAENPPSRTSMFASNLTMAGISSYYAGRYDQAIDAMDKAIYKDDTIREAYLYTALSNSRKGDKSKTLEFLTKYIKSHPTQSILSNSVQAQLTDLETDSGPLDAVAPAVEAAAYRQFINNVNFSGDDQGSVNSLCNSPFWWRSNRAPCSHNTLVNR